EWALSGKRSTIFLRPLAGRNWEAVVRVHADGRLIQVASGHDLALTMGIAEEKVVRKAKSDSLRMIDRSAPWRQQTATPKQLRLLAKLKIPAVEGMLAGDASDLIAAAMATQPRRIHTCDQTLSPASRSRCSTCPTSTPATWSRTPAW